MSKNIVVYSNTGCAKCMMLKKWLDMKKIDYDELNISENEDARKHLIDAGLRQLPQVEIDNNFIEFEEYNDILKYL